MSRKSRGKTWRQPVQKEQRESSEIDKLKAAIKEIQEYLEKSGDPENKEAKAKEMIGMEIRSAAFEIFAHTIGPHITQTVDMLGGAGAKDMERADPGSEVFEAKFDDLELDIEVAADFCVFAAAKIGERFWPNVQARRKKDVSPPTEFKEGDKIEDD